MPHLLTIARLHKVCAERIIDRGDRLRVLMLVGFALEHKILGNQDNAEYYVAIQSIKEMAGNPKRFHQTRNIEKFNLKPKGRLLQPCYVITQPWTWNALPPQ